MPTYFGYVSTFNNWSANANYWFRNKGYIDGFTCPGSGNQVVKELSIYAKSAGGTPGNIQVAIFDSSHNLLGQGVAEVTVDSTIAAWVGHLTQADITPNPLTIVGGTQYDLAFAQDSNDVQYNYTTGSAGDYTYGTTDYTGGFPATLNDGSDSVNKRPIRCGVDPAAGGLSILQLAQSLGGNANVMTA